MQNNKLHRRLPPMQALQWRFFRKSGKFLTKNLSPQKYPKAQTEDLSRIKAFVDEKDPNRDISFDFGGDYDSQPDSPQSKLSSATKNKMYSPQDRVRAEVDRLLNATTIKKGVETDDELSEENELYPQSISQFSKEPYQNNKLAQSPVQKNSSSNYVDNALTTNKLSEDPRKKFVELIELQLKKNSIIQSKSKSPSNIQNRRGLSNIPKEMVHIQLGINKAKMSNEITIFGDPQSQAKLNRSEISNMSELPPIKPKNTSRYLGFLLQGGKTIEELPIVKPKLEKIEQLDSPKSTKKSCAQNTSLLYRLVENSEKASTKNSNKRHKAHISEQLAEEIKGFNKLLNEQNI